MLLAGRRRVHEVARRIDVVVIVAGVGESLASLTGEADHQSRCDPAWKIDPPVGVGPLGRTKNQAADLTVGRELRSSNCCGLR
jgi:hypothetical protein